MHYTENTRKSHFLALCFYLAFSITCCNNFSEKKDNYDNINSFKEEANYLTELASENLNIIEICESLEQLKLEKELDTTIRKIKLEQSEVQSNIKRLAEENIVLIANVADENYSIPNSISEDLTEVKKALNSLQNKREKQLIILENLEDLKTDNKTKLVTKNLKNIIKSNIDITYKALETLK